LVRRGEIAGRHRLRPGADQGRDLPGSLSRLPDTNPRETWTASAGRRVGRLPGFSAGTARGPGSGRPVHSLTSALPSLKDRRGQCPGGDGAGSFQLPIRTVGTIISRCEPTLGVT